MIDPKTTYTCSICRNLVTEAELYVGRVGSCTGGTGTHAWMKTPDSLSPSLNPLVSFPSGATSSPTPRYDLIPRRAMERLTRRFESGLLIHKSNSWNARQNPQTLQDKEFLIARCAHIINHAYRLIDKLEGREVPNPEDDDASAIAWGGICLTEATEAAKETKT